MKGSAKKKKASLAVVEPVSPPSTNLQSLAIVGRGGMGEVHRGRLTGPGGFAKSVAVKKIIPDLAADPHFREMFLAEGRLLARISHPNVVQVFEVREEGDSLAMVMEWVDGITLKTLIERMLPDESLAIAILDDLLKALVTLHEFKDPDTGEAFRIIHRDISPHNIMIDHHGIIKLLDFGVAKSLSTNQDFTKTEFPKGKFPYLSPEMAKGDPIDERSDLFSLGIVAFEMTTGQRLFKGTSDLETIELVKTGVIPPLKQIRKDLTGEFCVFVDTLLQRDPTKRFHSARTALTALRRGTVERATEDEIRRILSANSKDIAPVSSGTVSDSPLAPQRASTQKRSKYNFAKPTKLIVGISVFLLVCLCVARKWSQSEVAHLVWDHAGKKIDLSRPPESALPLLQGEYLDTSACYSLCSYLGNIPTFFLLDSIAKSNDLKANYKPAKKYLAEMQSNLDTNKSALEQVWKQCGRISYCESAKNLLSGFREIIAKSDLSSVQKYSEVSSILQRGSSPHWEQWRTKDFMHMDSVLGKRFLATDRVLTSPDNVFRTSAYAGFDLVKVPEEVFPQTSSDCRDLGDLFYAKNMDLEKMEGKWKTGPSTLWILPKTSSLLIESFDASRLYVRIPDETTDALFSRGICFYSRKNLEKGSFARHWLPSVPD